MDRWRPFNEVEKSLSEERLWLTRQWAQRVWSGEATMAESPPDGVDHELLSYYLGANIDYQPGLSDIDFK